VIRGKTVMTDRVLGCFYERRLLGHKAAWLAGDATALEAALHYCSKHSLPVPDWLRDLFVAGSPARLAAITAKKMGRSNSAAARKYTDMVHYARYDTVCEIREQQLLQQRTLDELRATPNAPRHMILEKERMLRFVGRSLDDAFECASQLLDGTPARGKAGTIKRSYNLVARTSKNPDKAMRFMILDGDFLRSIKIVPHEDWPDPASKVDYFVALTNGE
jgi:hypothetical protein